MNNTPSQTFLFDKYRSGRALFSIQEGQPDIVWAYTLPVVDGRVYGAESTPAFDSQENIYFGSHDGSFYSLDKNGKERWIFSTSKKIYSSPLLLEDKDLVMFCGGDGFFYSLNLQGNLVKKQKISHLNTNNQFASKIIDRLTFNQTYDFDRKKHVRYKSWCSPNIDANGNIYITGFGKGLYSFDANTLQVRWSRWIGTNLYKYSGVALDDFDNIYVSSSDGYACSFSQKGVLRWKVRIVDSRYKAWGNPSIDIENQKVLFNFNLAEKESVLACTDFNGVIQWQRVLDGGSRGSIAVGYDNHYYCAALSGELHYINRSSGISDLSIKVSDAQRGLWTTPTISSNNYVLLTCKDSGTEGRLVCFDASGKQIWQIDIGKSLSTPVIDHAGKIYVGSWKGKMMCLGIV